MQRHASEALGFRGYVIIFVGATLFRSLGSNPRDCGHPGGSGESLVPSWGRG